MATKTKEAAMKAARKALGKHAAEGVDYALRNTGAGWEFEAIPPANAPARKARAAKAVSKPATITQTQADAAVKAHRAPRRKLADAVKPKPQGERPTPPAGTKTELVMKMISRPQGATSKQIEDATGWAPHSVRGLLGTFRASGVKVLSSKEKGQPTIYRVGGEPGDVI